MADENKISRRSFLKGAAAAGAVAATGIPTKAGPDKFTTMLKDLKKDFKAIQKLEARSHALGSHPAGIRGMIERGEITKSFANRILPLLGPDPTGEKLKEKKKFRAQFQEQYKQLVPAYNKKLDSTRNYAEKNNKMVSISGTGDVTKLKPGEKAVYEKAKGMAGYRAKGYVGEGVIPQITTADFRAAKKAHEKKTGKKITNRSFSYIYNEMKRSQKPKPKSAVKGGRGGAGAGRNEAGVHTIFEGPKLVKVEKDYRKGGMVLSTTNNLKKR